MRSSQAAASSPRIKVEPESSSTDAPDAVRLARAYYLEPMPWQELVLASWLGRTASGDWSAKRAGILVGRQNGKSSLLIARELFGLLVLGESIIHTAHLQTTSRAHFEALVDVLEHRDLKPLVKHITYSVGRERIVLANRGSVRFMTRSRGSARGLTADLIVCDEAQEVTDEQLEALMPALSAAPLEHSQIIFAGTPPGENASGAVFGRMRDDAVKGADGSLSWHEWSVDSIGDVTDRERWRAVNPSLGILLSERTVEIECSQMSPEGFARERLSYWPVHAAKPEISSREWEPLATASPPMDGVCSYGVKFSSNAQAVSLAVCLKPEEGPQHVELIGSYDLSRGCSELTAWLAERWKSVGLIAIDGMQGAPMLEQALISAGVSRKSLHIMGAKDTIAASSMFVDAIRSGAVTHYGQEQLTHAAMTSKRRNIGAFGGYGFASIDGSDISPFEAACIAFWASSTSKRKARKGNQITII